MAGPDGSRTNRVAVTPEGDLIEVGQTEIGGVPRPTIRKRSSLTGAELWPEKTITLDTREGAVVDVAVLPDGRMWVAMNVREPMQDPRPRIALLDADGHATDDRGPRHVRPRGPWDRGGRGRGCFAVGVAGVQGDWDIAYWRITQRGRADARRRVRLPAWTALPHKFRDLANDVLIDGDVAWIVGLSHGKHDEDVNRIGRGVLVPMDLHTGEVARARDRRAERWAMDAERVFRRALHPDGRARDRLRLRRDLLRPVPDRDLALHRRRASAVARDGGSERRPGLRQRRRPRQPGARARAGAVTQNGKLRGYVFGRAGGQQRLTVIEHWYPGAGPSEALGIVRDSFDRIFPAGYLTSTVRRGHGSLGSTGSRRSSARRDSHCGAKLPHASSIMPTASSKKGA
jgi:hypothetical protein